LKNKEQPSEDLSVQEDMVGALVDTLEEKGMVSAEDIDIKMRKRLKSKKKLTKFDDLL